MKFCKRYEEYMQGRRGKELPVVGLRKLKKILKRCRRDFQSQNQHGHEEGGSPHEGNRCLDRCPVCDRTFFPSLIKEMSAVVGYFNERAQKLLKLHLASGFRKYLMCFGCKSQRSRGALIQEGKDLLAYAIINSIAMRKILKKYDKVHYSKQGQAFRSQAQSRHIEILQSPWFCELMAFSINLRQSKVNSKAFRGLVDECLLTCDDDKPMLSCGLLESMKVEIDLTCSICLDIVFDPVSLTCGHIFCFMCCCSAGSVSIVDGLKAVGKKAKCPLCRQAGVYAHAVRLDELNILLRRSCRDYWVERLQSERVERLRRTKEHWQFQCQAFLGV